MDFDHSDTRGQLFPDLLDDGVTPAWRARELGSVHFHRARPCASCGGHDFVRYVDRNKQDQRDKLRCHGCKLDEHQINKANYLFLKARRRATLLSATPSWLGRSQLEDMRKLYRLSQRLEEQTGVAHQVDHIVPLQSPVVCGLHVPWNLQVITASANASKGNRFDPLDSNRAKLLEKFQAAWPAAEVMLLAQGSFSEMSA